MGIHWDRTITLGSIVTTMALITTIVGAYFAFVKRIEIQIAVFGKVLEFHAATLTSHSARLLKHEEDATELVATVQRLVGRSEVELNERRVSTPRRHEDLSTGEVR